MLFAIILVSSAVAGLVSADLGKTPLFPNGLHDPLSGLDHLNIPTNTWASVAAPSLCVQHAKDAGCNTATVEARSITYGDCSTPWTLCRCDNANMNMDDLMNRFGQIPVGLRSYVGSALAINAASCSSGTSGDFIVVQGDCAVSVFIHESSHSLDQGASSTPGWANAVAASSCVPDPYSNTNYQEDFAQVDVLFTYQYHVGKIPADTSCLQPQLDFFGNDPRLNQDQTTTTCFPDKRPFTLRKRSAKFDHEDFVARDGSPTVQYVPIHPTPLN